MRSKQGFLLFLFMALLFLCIDHHHLPAAASPVENMKENDQERGIAIAHRSKLSHGTIGGGGNGGNTAVTGSTAVVSGENNGGSHNPGGGGVTPLYAAGAGNNRHPHHGGGNRAQGRTWPETLAITTFAWFLLLCINQYL
ncbi:hypothetical protein C2S51_022567 [Perilla frutescens var. frutescens]|nr:hypothetical protein C2S51_022567 [Perilla frutescens var. frutescens]